MAGGWFDTEGHLNDAGIVYCANTWREGRVLDEELRDHLDNCEDCREALLEYRLFLEQTEGNDRISPYEPVQPKPEYRSSQGTLWKVAATVLLIAAFGWLFTRSGGLSEQEIAVRVKSLTETGSVPFWDEQISGSGVVRGGVREVLSPAKDTVLLTGEVVFALAQQPDTEVKVEFFIGKNEADARELLFETGTRRVTANNLEEGLYYWRLFERAESGRWRSVFVSRFYMINNQNR